MRLIPTGIENFKTMIDKDAYYIDNMEGDFEAYLC